MEGGEKPEFPRRFYSLDRDPRPGKSVNYFSNDRKLFPALHASLKKDEWAEIERSSLGVFLKFYKLNFAWASRLVHHLLAFQLECGLSHEIWSLIGVNPIRFSLYEFEELTGLNCGYVDDGFLDMMEVTDEMRAFWKKLGVNINAGPSIEALTRACSVCKGWTRQERIRLGYLAIYAGFIVPHKPSQSTPKYPWGRVAFKKLIESVKRTTDFGKTYQLEGFLEVLQVWAYYAMPEYGAVFGEPIKGDPSPPVLAYVGSRGRKYVRRCMLEQTLFKHMVVKQRDEMYPYWPNDNSSDDKVENIFRAFFWEINSSWKWDSSHWEVEGIKASPAIKSESSIKPESSSDTKGADEGDRKRSRPSESSYMDDRGSTSFVDSLKTYIMESCEVMTREMQNGFLRCDQNFLILNCRVEQIEKSVAGLQKGKEAEGDGEQVKSSKGDGNPTQAAAAGPSRVPKMEEFSESVNFRAEESVEFVENNKCSEEEQLLHTYKRQKKRQDIALTKIRGKVDQLKWLNKTQKDHKPLEKTVPAIFSVENERSGGYDPFAPVDKQKTKVLLDWLKLDPDYGKKIKGTSAYWFYILRTKTKWLMDTHLDAFTDLLRLRYTKHPEHFRSERLCFLDTVFGALWSTKYKAFLSFPPNPDGTGRLLPANAHALYSGEEPAYCRSDKTWLVDVDDVYAPLNVTDDHWLALWISLPARHIVIWDSSSVHASDAVIAKAIEPFTVMLPHLIRVFTRDYSLAPFTYQRYCRGKVPENIQSGDCGVYCLKYIECHSLGKAFPPYLCDRNIEVIREKIAAEIFDETEFRGQDRKNWDHLDTYDGV